MAGASPRSQTGAGHGGQNRKAWISEPGIRISSQSEAIEELLSPKARPVVVTTGTGSGKTEAFLLPVIQNAIEDAILFKKPGLTAILVYPMNAPANDQILRIREYLRDAGFSGSVTVDQYDRGTPQAKREALRDNPPHILLTNYMMLEYLLVRPAEMIAGEVPAPALALGNRDVLLRHLNAIVFGAAEPGLAGRMIEYVSTTGEVKQEAVDALIQGLQARFESGLAMAAEAFGRDVLDAAGLDEAKLRDHLNCLPARTQDVFNRTSRQIIELRQALDTY